MDDNGAPTDLGAIARASLEAMERNRAEWAAKEKAKADSEPKPLKPLQPSDVYRLLACGCHRGFERVSCDQHKDQP